MRIAIAEVSQESDTFSPLTADLRDFEGSTLLFGKQVLEQRADGGCLSGARSCLAEHKDVELIPLLQATATSGGKLTRETVRTLEKRLLEALRESMPLDGFLFSLHGATVAEDMDDVCGHLLQAARRLVGDSTRVVVPLDHHANVTGS